MPRETGVELVRPATERFGLAVPVELDQVTTAVVDVAARVSACTTTAASPTAQER